jgi:hypothetical protein
MAVGAFRGFANPCNSAEAHRTRMGLRQPFLLCWIYCRGLAVSAIDFRRPAPKLFSDPQGAGSRSRAEFKGARRYPPDWTPAPEVRSQIEKAIVAGLKDEVAHEYARDAYGDLPKQFEQNATSGKTKLIYEIQAFHLSPDGFPRLFVRARWMVDQQMALLMSLWLRVGPEVKVERVDGESNRNLWLSAKSGESLAEEEVSLGQLGQVLNVFDRTDGYGDVLIYFAGYEGYDIHLFRYTDAGLVATKISHGDGC